ncbi:UDP-N-acetylglucosamine 2-epimerase (non-hydrolyzing) [Spirosoma lacussanchae]|uniref:non-hydrolyzing UDP-N-acetylglucosamine 2-epimerase n=1 Tax=Spirosoma lacussanchae TaxID=1884249 RepID=UPI001109825C|nr:UDP-N-acetylglucosamine 2-epimerase (non-hydrolyzing) [Spirosoma lacussanchae]
MKLITVVGTRPNIVKVAPLHQAFNAHPALTNLIVHTGQHYDARLSDLFFQQLNLPAPDYVLGVGPGSIPQQTAGIMARFEAVLLTERPDWVVVVGDVTSTLACALVAVQLGIRVAHVEAGLRSGDRRMPEETNRLLTDQLADLLFVTETAGLENLRREGIRPQKIHFVGNVLIDALQQCLPRASALDTVGSLGLEPRQYILMTMHRAANVDSADGLRTLLQLISDTAQQRTVLFPMHPRTRASLTRFGLLNELEQLPNVRLLEPQGYLEFLNLLDQAALVITDSGGVQEETTYLGVPCLTFRDSTERPVTTTLGTNQLLSDLNPNTVRMRVTDLLTGTRRPAAVPPLWDGQTARRIANCIAASRA